jgi:hypothetical protein
MRKLYQIINNQIAFVLFLTIFLMFLTHIVSYTIDKSLKSSNFYRKNYKFQNYSTDSQESMKNNTLSD